MISVREHAFYEYSLGATLILSPFLFGFNDLDFARTTFFVIGAALILFALLEDDLHAWRRLIPIPILMTLDVFAAAGLVAAPWILNYRAFLTPGQELLHYVIAVGIIALVGLTRVQTGARAQSRNQLRAALAMGRH